MEHPPVSWQVFGILSLNFVDSLVVPLYCTNGYLWRHNRMMVWTLKEFKDVLLQVELGHRLLVALVSPAWVTRSSRILRLMWRSQRAPIVVVEEYQVSPIVHSCCAAAIQ